MEDEFISVSSVTANRISEMIFIEKKYLPGDRLPNEYKLSSILGVSRTSLREAIKLLAAKGILIIKRGSGTFVANSFDMSSFGIKYIEDKKRLAQHWFEFRLILEPKSARMAAKNANYDEIERICASAENILKLINEDKPFTQEDQNFHALIATATKNDVIKLTLPSLENAVSEALKTSTYIGTFQKSCENVKIYHPAIADFIKCRDEDGAEMAMRMHILKVFNLIKN